MPDAAPTLRSPIQLWLKTAVTLTLVALIAAIVPWGELWRHAKQLDPQVWLLALAAFVAAHALGICKWRTVIHAGRAKLSQTEAVHCYGAGLFANMFLPTIAGGDALRAVLAGRLTRRYSVVICAGLADRLIDTAAVVSLAALGALLSRHAWPSEVVIGGAAAAALGVIGVLSLILVLRHYARSRRPARFARPALRAAVAARRLWRQPRVGLLVFVCSLIIQSTVVALHAWLGHSVGIDVPWTVWLFAVPLSKLVGMLPISIAGLGVREASLAGLLLLASVPAEQGILVSLLWRTILVTSGLLGGLCWGLVGTRGGALENRPSEALPASQS